MPEPMQEKHAVMKTMHVAFETAEREQILP